MIVSPEFFRHWKIQSLESRLSEPLAGYYVLRLWAFCHERHRTTLDGIPDVAIASICGYRGEPGKFVSLLIELRLLERGNDDVLFVHDWDEHNAKLVANWVNGKNGGRPKKRGKQRNENPTETQIEIGLTQNGIGVTDKRREDKIREEEKKRERSQENQNGELVLTPKKIPPPLNAVVLYGEQIGLSQSDCESFYDHFTANGWKVSGRSPMRDWMAAMRNWLKRKPEFEKHGTHQKPIAGSQAARATFRHDFSDGGADATRFNTALALMEESDHRRSKRA